MCLTLLLAALLSLHCGDDRRVSSRLDVAAPSDASFDATFDAARTDSSVDAGGTDAGSFVRFRTRVTKSMGVPNVVGFAPWNGSGLTTVTKPAITSRVKDKHVRIRIEQCLALAKASNCPRRTFGALLLDPVRNVVLMDGYNGGPRGGGDLCGGDVCLRDALGVQSGTRMEIGCHHAEMNVICNAAANGVACGGAWLIVTGEPCLLCAKLIHHAGIARVLIVEGGYLGENGVQYLRDHGVGVQTVEGPRDPRLVALEAANVPPKPTS